MGWIVLVHLFFSLTNQKYKSLFHSFAIILFLIRHMLGTQFKMLGKLVAGCFPGRNTDVITPEPMRSLGFQAASFINVCLMSSQQASWHRQWGIQNWLNECVRYSHMMFLVHFSHGGEGETWILFFVFLCSLSSYIFKTEQPSTCTA